MILIPLLIFPPIFVLLSFAAVDVSGIADLDGGKFSQLWKGSVSDPHFNLMIETVFDDPNLRYDGYKLIGGGYEIWLRNGWGFLTFNGVGGFSARQKYKFFKRFKKWRQPGKKLNISVEDALTTPALRIKQNELADKELLGD